MTNALNTLNPSWWDKYEVHDPSKKVKSFKLEEGSTEIELRSNGREYHSELDGKDYLVFEIVHESTVKPWYVNAKNFSLINSMKALGLPLIGRKLLVTRTGKAKQTRWSISIIQE